MRLTAPILALLLFASPASAADLSVSVTAPGGKPIRDAVVTVHVASARQDARSTLPPPYRMVQKDLQFDPLVLAIPVGADVAFPNLDPVRHHVYSFSAPHPFELKLYGRDQTRSVRFDKPGIIAVGCNIHDQMVAFIDVVDTPYAAKTNAAGEAVIHGVPGGRATLRIWHPYARAPQNRVERPIVVPADGAAREAAVLDVRVPVMHHHAY